MNDGRIIPVDIEARDKASSDLDRSYCMEAGAGTGKTTLLVSRYMNIISDGRAACGRIVAITFTEKAASEMKVRLRREIEEQLAGVEEETLLAERLEAAMSEIESAPISTIHAFASSILREYPVEAGLDPDFTLLDAVESDIFMDECWNIFLSGTREPYDSIVKAWLNTGGNLETLRSMADSLYAARGHRVLGGIFDRSGRDYRGIVEAEKRETSGAPAGESPSRTILGPLREYLDSAALELSSLLGSSCIDRSDAGAHQINGFLAALGQAEELEGDMLLEYLLLLDMPKAKGNQKNWMTPDDCRRQKSLVREMEERHAEFRKEYTDWLARGLEKWFDRFLAIVEERKRERSLLDFDDLLIKTRELLDDETALGSLRRSIRYILVDEFQDTDPVQAEIIMLLAGEGGSAGDLSLTEGKLFIVGDPKQSIYRFRNADVEIYEKVKKRFQKSGAHLKISQNFRSVPGVVKWVNSTFSGIIRKPEEGFYQPEYEPIEPARAEKGASVVSLGLDRAGEKADEIRLAESRAVAGFIGDLVDRQLEVKDTVTKEERPVRYSDIALLYRGTTGIEYYEDSLRSASIPFLTEGGKLFYTRQEIRDLASVIWTIEDPYDSLSLVASLRSAVFGFSDEELFFYRNAGGDFNYLRPTSPEEGGFEDLAQAFAMLRRLHSERNHLGPAGTLRELLKGTRFAEQCAESVHGQQKNANIRKAVQTARDFSHRGHSFRHYARWFRDQEKLEASEGESPGIDEGENAVRLLTIHKSKGLQFPVVIIVNLIQKMRAPDRILVADGRKLAFRSGSKWETSDYERLSALDAERDSAEKARLLYVAATRTGDLLVIPRRPGSAKGKDYYSILAASLETDLEANSFPFGGKPGEVVGIDGPRYSHQQERGKVTPGREQAGPGMLERLVAEKNRWMKERSDLISAAGTAPLFLSPAGLERYGRYYSPDREDDVLAEKSGRDEALDFGKAFHWIMEHVDLEGGSDIGLLSSSAADRFGIAGSRDELASLAADTLAGEIVSGASGADTVLREAEFSIPLPSGAVQAEREVSMPRNILSGRIDLLYEKCGVWTLVDYKTDDILPGEVEERAAAYRNQGLAYAWALSKAGIVLSGGVNFLFVRSGSCHRIDIDAGSLREAEEMFASVLR